MMDRIWAVGVGGGWRSFGSALVDGSFSRLANLPVEDKTVAENNGVSLMPTTKKHETAEAQLNRSFEAYG